ncbi:NADH dehydrogenase (ubiquinone) complex I, assembly factor 6 homolog sicily [Oratosquilla oratoria]|uniref:NADH dehydrogenase (ubiquinone) complex I, assembly factor 6 homolog sicily n=1 Tax=Oratosquilla oratoria TaxID=337810 RepID=UPI003F77116C
MAISWRTTVTAGKIRNRPTNLNRMIIRYNMQRPLGRSMASKTQKPLDSCDYCVNIVRQTDHENFLATLLLPQQARQATFALRALNSEVAQVRDMTTEKLTGLMRLQFWRDTLEKIYAGQAPRQPIAMELQKAVQRHKLSRRWLNQLVDSREDRMDDHPFTSVAAIEDYAEKSNSALYFLILQSLGVQNVQADHAASHLGKAEGIARIIRGVPHLANKRQVILPIDILIRHRVSQEDLMRGKREQKIKDVMYDIASVAHQHLEHARSLTKDVPKEARVALLPAVGVSAFLKTLQKADFDVFHPQLQLRNSWLPLTLWWTKTKNSY